MKYIYALIVICFLLTFIWFRQGNILGGGDAGLAFYSPRIAFNLSKTIWVEYGTGGSTMGWLPTAGLLYFYSIWENLGVPSVILQGSYFLVILLTGVLSVYFLSQLFLKEKNQLIAFVASLFYLFNPFTMSQIWARGQPAQQTSFALLPLALLLFAVGIRRKNFSFAFLIALASVIFATAFSYLTFVIVFWMVLFIFLLFNRSIFSMIFFLSTFISWLVTNAWWFLPLFTSSGTIYSAGISGSEENLGTLLGVSMSFPLNVIIRLLQKTYFFDPSAFSTIYSSLPFQIISLLAPLFLFIGLIKAVKKDGELKYFIILFVLGLVVSLGANPPTGWLFVMLFKQFPVLQAFRNPYEKFGQVYTLGYSLLFAYGLILAFNKSKYKIPAITAVLVLICGVFAWPMWTGRVIAGPDQKIGLSAPSYYKDLNSWLKENNGDERVLMTPIWSGDGAFYQWNGGRYQGSDPMIYLLDQPTISNTLQGSFYFEYLTGIRKYMERMNLVPALALLRTKYIVDRKDATMLTDSEKEHWKFLTESIYPPLEDSGQQKICQDQNVSSSANGTAWIVCPISEINKDLSKARYLMINIKTDVPALLDISVRDRKKTAIRWDGRIAEEYRTLDGNFTKIIVPLSSPTEYNNNIDFADVEQIDILARQIGPGHFSVGEITLKSIIADPGREVKNNTYSLVKTFGNLKVFEPHKFISPPEVGLLNALEQVEDIPQLFRQANTYSDRLDKKGFVLVSQNPEKNLTDLPKRSETDISDKQKISNTRYWLRLTDKQKGLVLLSKTFNTQWKIIPGVTRQELAGNLFADLALLKKKPLGEDSHFVVNGYGNLWKTDGQADEYAIVYMPQIVADIGSTISKYSLLILSAVMALWFLKKRINYERRC